MEPKGIVLIRKEFVHTKLWPNPQMTLEGWVDLEAEYKKALAGKTVTVIDVAVDDSAYLVAGITEKGVGFIWIIEKADTFGLIPYVVKDGLVMPAGMDMMQELMWKIQNTKLYKN